MTTSHFGLGLPWHSDPKQFLPLHSTLFETLVVFAGRPETVLREDHLAPPNRRVHTALWLDGQRMTPGKMQIYFWMLSGCCLVLLCRMASKAWPPNIGCFSAIKAPSLSRACLVFKVENILTRNTSASPLTISRLLDSLPTLNLFEPALRK